MGGFLLRFLWLLAVVAFAASSHAANQAPVVTLTSPGSGSTYNAPATISLAANASDPDGSIDHVEFYQGTTLIASVKPGPYTFQWTGVAAGNYSLTAKAFDNLNKSTTSTAVSISVVAVTTFVTSPADGAVVSTNPVSVNGTFVGPDTTTVIVTAGGGHSVVASVSAGSFAADVALSPGANTIEVQVARRDGTSQVVTSHITYVAPPVVAFTAPASCGPYVVPTPITFAVDAASLGSTITKVDFFDNNVPIGTASSPPYTISPTYIAFGSRLIRATATDANGFTGSATMVITAQTQPPQVQVTSPIDGSTYSTGAPVPLAATATDPDGTISSFSILVDGGLAIGGSSPLSTNYTFTSPGSHVITARATDNSDMTATSAPVTVNISVNTPPSVSLTSPVSGTSYAAPASVTLQATASDSDGTIKQVQFQRDGGIVVATVTQPPYSATAGNLAAGSHSFVAIATDNSNAQTTSSTVSVNVVNDALPTVSITSPPANASFSPPADVVISAAASDSDGSIAKVDFLADGNLIETVTAAPYTFTWTNAPLGTHSLTAKATDNVGGSTVSSPIQITVAGITAAITSPADGSTYVAPAGFTIQATSTTSSGNITSVDFLDGSAVLNTIIIPTGFSTVNVSQGLSAVPAGTHVYTVKSHDDGGRVGTSLGVTVNVTAPPTPPTLALTSPSNNARYIAPAMISLSADATAGSSPIAKVEFYEGSNLIGTSTNTPYVAVWSNVAPGNYAVTAVVTDAGGNQATSAVADISVATGPALTIDSNIPGLTVPDNRITVSGTALLPPNGAVIVNNLLANLDEAGNWFVDNVPLEPGANTLTVSTSALDYDPILITASVTSTGSLPFELTVDPAEDIVSFSPVITLQQRAAISFGRAEFDFDNDGVPDFTVNALTDGRVRLQLTVAQAGIGTVGVKVFDPSNTLIYAATRKYHAVSAGSMSQFISNEYTQTLQRLSNGDISGALRRFTDVTSSQYQSIFVFLGARLPSAVAALGAITSVSVSTSSAEIELTRSTAGGTRVFPVSYIRGSDGLWRIDGM